MSKTIVIKPEFDAKLKKLRIKTKFMNNFGKWGTCIDTQGVLYLKSECLNAHCWYSFVVSAFESKLSPQGQDFWYEVATL
jgi:hypothetical protein